MLRKRFSWIEIEKLFPWRTEQRTQLSNWFSLLLRRVGNSDLVFCLLRQNLASPKWPLRRKFIGGNNLMADAKLFIIQSYYSAFRHIQYPVYAYIMDQLISNMVYWAIYYSVHRKQRWMESYYLLTHLPPSIVCKCKCVSGNCILEFSQNRIIGTSAQNYKMHVNLFLRKMLCNGIGFAFILKSSKNNNQSLSVCGLWLVYLNAKKKNKYIKWYFSGQNGFA